LNCTYKNPSCDTCILQKTCRAYKEDLVGTIPTKSKKIKKRSRYFHYLVLIDDDDKVLIEQRDKKDIWKGLYQFPLIEKEKTDDAIALHDIKQIGLRKRDLPEPTQQYKQTLTHQYIYAWFYICRRTTLDPGPGQSAVALNRLGNYAWPRLINQFLDEELQRD